MLSRDVCHRCRVSFFGKDNSTDIRKTSHAYVRWLCPNAEHGYAAKEEPPYGCPHRLEHAIAAALIKDHIDAK